MGVGVVSHTSNIDSPLSELFAYLNAWILELAKWVWIIEVGLYQSSQSNLLFKVISDHLIYLCEIYMYLEFHQLIPYSGKIWRALNLANWLLVGIGKF